MLGRVSLPTGVPRRVPFYTGVPRWVSLPTGVRVPRLLS
jgi:hypothetical protein